ncbi:thioredoxin-related protein [Flavobacterium sp. PL11]|jgi:thioredoxin-related protein|uniref:thioredoxin family protein n=1 Tax=Flavobacterium sp. PL11 TaxID=3071717 RepID=UPI002DFE9975|nr:thioredoxin-related protein [Flavobacterium sp. PL11]
MKKAVYILLLILWAMPSGFAQLKLNTFEEVEQLSKVNPKPIVIFTHTNWCAYCTLMENTTFKDPKIIATLNEYFYFISFDAETKTDIFFNNTTFKFQPTGTNIGIHQLATALATIDNQVVYPSLAILDRENAIVFQQHSALKANKFFVIIDKLK